MNEIYFQSVFANEGDELHKGSICLAEHKDAEPYHRWRGECEEQADVWDGVPFDDGMQTAAQANEQEQKADDQCFFLHFFLIDRQVHSHTEYGQAVYDPNKDAQRIEPVVSNLFFPKKDGDQMDAQNGQETDFGMTDNGYEEDWSKDVIGKDGVDEPQVETEH